jgi:hypothetical protein|tara:strand:- start:235 stop:627 length:393 start_codon:yes stop_codon:yes gene_type:complete
MESNNKEIVIKDSKKRKFNSVKRKKILSKIKKIKKKEVLKKILKIVKLDLGDKISKNNNGFFFDMNTLSDTSLIEVSEILNDYYSTETSESEIKFSYTPYKGDEVSNNGIGPKLSNKEKNLLKNKKNNKK